MPRRCPNSDAVRNALDAFADPLDPSDVAEVLGITTQAVYLHIKDGSLRAHNVSSAHAARATYKVYKTDLLRYCGVSVDRPSLTPDTRYILEPAFYGPVGGIHIETDVRGRVIAIWVGNPTQGGDRLEIIEPHNPMLMAPPSAQDVDEMHTTAGSSGLLSL